MVIMNLLYAYSKLLWGGGQRQMCKAMEERIDRERIEVLFEAVKSLMKNMDISAEQAMEAMNVSAEDKEVLLKRL